MSTAFQTPSYLLYSCHRHILSEASPNMKNEDEVNSETGAICGGTQRKGSESCSYCLPMSLGTASKMVCSHQK